MTNIKIERLTFGYDQLGTLLFNDAKLTISADWTPTTETLIMSSSLSTRTCPAMYPGRFPIGNQPITASNAKDTNAKEGNIRKFFFDYKTQYRAESPCSNNP